MTAEERVRVAVEAWGDRIVRFAHALTADPGAAQDVAQETFLRLYLWLRRHPRQAAPNPAWLFTVARNLACDLRRRRWPLLLPDPPAAVDAPDHDQRLAVRATLHRLAAADRKALELFYYGDLAVADIAKALGIPIATVKTRLYRARRHFAALWSETVAAQPGGTGDG